MIPDTDYSHLLRDYTGEIPANEYPADWKKIAWFVKARRNWCCERCNHQNDRDTGYVLTTHHLDGNKANCADWNLAALCQRCHLHIQNKVVMEQLFFMAVLDVSEWFKPHLAGYVQSKIDAYGQ